MKNILKVAGSYYGDKGIANIPNLKLGEYRFYSQDNSNIINLEEISPIKFKYLFEKAFPDNPVLLSITEESTIDNIQLQYGGIYMYDRTGFNIHYLNKAYFCIEEASEEKDGVCLGIQDCWVWIANEKWNPQDAT
jgi:hypothetical protein